MHTSWFVVGIAACIISFAIGAAEEGGIKVSVAIYSGRQDPKWEIKNSEDAQNIREKLTNLSEIEGTPSYWKSSGFRGFIISGIKQSGIAIRVRVFNGVIGVLSTGRNEKYYKDDKGLEKMLIALSKEQNLEPAVKEAITSHEASLK